MTWLWLTLLRTVFLAGLEVTWKLFLNKQSYPILTIAFWTSLVPVVALSPLVFSQKQYLALADTVYLQAILANVTLNIFGDLLLFRMIKKHEVSYISALSATSPMFYLLFGWLFLGETISYTIFAFFIVIVLGGFLLEISRRHATSNWAELLKSSSFISMALYIILTSLATVASKVAITSGPVEGYIAFRYLLLCLSFYILNHLWAYIRKVEAPRFMIKENMPLVLAGGLLTFAVVAEMYAYTFAEIALVDAVSKLTLVFTFIFEYALIQRTFNKHRLLAITLIMTGTAFVAYLA